MPSENTSEPPKWACECCGIGFWYWLKKEDRVEFFKGGGMFHKQWVIHGLCYGDKAPMSVKIGEKEYGVCSPACFKNVFLVKSLEAVAAAISNLAQKR